MEYWFTKSIKNILIDQCAINNPSKELVKWVEYCLDNHGSPGRETIQDLDILTQLKVERLKMYGKDVSDNTDWSKMALKFKEPYKSIPFYYFIFGFTEKELMFIANNFMETFSTDKKDYYIEFFNETNDLPNQKEIALEYIQTNDLVLAIESCKKEIFDLSLLDFLTDKINDDKMLNWGVGQVMKQYPKRFSPQEVKEALQKRFYHEQH